MLFLMCLGDLQKTILLLPLHFPGKGQTSLLSS
jgi:hypothetical protein